MMKIMGILKNDNRDNRDNRLRLDKILLVKKVVSIVVKKYVYCR